MKNRHIFFLVLISFFMVTATPASFAVKHIIHVGNYYFNPSSLNTVNSGDTIRWVWDAGTHTTTSTTIPAGAATWDSPITAAVTSYEYKATVAGTYNYKCTPHSAMGMVGSFTVTAAVPLSVSATADPSSLCAGFSTQLHAIVSGGTGSYTYSWTSNPPGFTSNLQNPVATPLVTTSYNVTVTSGAETDNASTEVTATTPPAVDAGHDTSYCVYVTEFVVEGSASNYSGVSWTTLGDGAFTDGISLTDIYSPGPEDVANGSVDLVLSVQAIAPCSESAVDTLHIILDPCLGISGKKADFSISAYPNPTSGAFLLSSAGVLNDQVLISVTAMDGRTIYSETVNPRGSSLQKQFDLSSYPSGVYFLSVTSGNSISAKRIIIQK